MGEGTKQVTLPPPGKFLEEINYQEIVEGEVRIWGFSVLKFSFGTLYSRVKSVKKNPQFNFLSQNLCRSV